MVPTEHAERIQTPTHSSAASVFSQIWSQNPRSSEETSPSKSTKQLVSEENRSCSLIGVFIQLGGPFKLTKPQLISPIQFGLKTRAICKSTLSAFREGYDSV